MINAALIGLGWWGKNHLTAAQGKSSRLRFVHGEHNRAEGPPGAAHGMAAFPS